MATAEQMLIQSLNLPSCLSDRILCRVSPSLGSANHRGEQQHHDSPVQGETTNVVGGGGRSFVLYLPTVVLRKRHNPAFAFACRLANHYGVPLLVLVTVLDDKHLSRPPLSPTVMTSRRLAFTLEALRESCCTDWESHGAGVAIRVHGTGCRNPHHLSLAHIAKAVVSDEPFVEPYRAYVRTIAKTCLAVSVPCWTVDGSTSVPPNSKLVRNRPPGGGSSRSSGKNASTTGHKDHSDVSFAGAPSKAWRWEKQTESVRKHHVYGAVREKALDAPELDCKLPPNFFLHKLSDEGEDGPCSNAEVGDIDQNNNKHINNNGDDNSSNSNNPWLERLLDLVPSKWKDREASAPGQRPWSVRELCDVADCKAWAQAWKGADSSVPPCRQTDGSATASKRRWRSFLEHGLKDYAKKRNGITNPHAVSRVSCYLNLGILSIFDVLHDVWEARSTRGYATGCNKYLEEVGKWREGSYVHAFANPDYHTVSVLPLWARRYLESMKQSAGSSGSSGSGYDYKELESASTKDEKWNAMQDYLIDTGELHNNARMTWGKTVVHWQASRESPDEILLQLCCLNDRFALDGLSPPSYGGVLWCFGWQDKPAHGNRVSEKWAHRYRTGPSGFLQAKEKVLDCCDDRAIESSSASLVVPNGTSAPVVTGKRTTSHNDGTPRTSPATKKARRDHPAKAGMRSDSKSILSYFGPAVTGAQRKIG